MVALILKLRGGSRVLLVEEAGNEIMLLPERWAVTVRLHAQFILHELGECPGYSSSVLLRSRRYALAATPTLIPYR